MGIVRNMSKEIIKRAKEGQPSEIHAKIIELINKGTPNPDICKLVGVKPHVIYYVKRTYKDRLGALQVYNNKPNINNYEGDLANILKNNILLIGNTIGQKDLQKASLSQLSTAMGIAIDKLRLLEGKSTANIHTHITNNMSEEQLNIIRESIKSLKESMLAHE